MRTRVGIAVIGLLALGGCASGSSGADTTPTPTETKAATGYVQGTVAVEADWLANVSSGQTSIGGPCTVESGYDDQTDGAQVVITDASGTTIGLGTLQSAGLQILDGSTDMADTWCEFRFTVGAVPKGEGYYGVAIGNRDAIQFAESEAFSGLDLSLGDIPVG